MFSSKPVSPSYQFLPFPSHSIPSNFMYSILNLLSPLNAVSLWMDGGQSIGLWV